MAVFTVSSAQTLRIAVETANSNGEADTIRFDAGVSEIAMDAQLVISDPDGLVIDGDHDDDGVSDIALLSIIGVQTGFYATDALFTVAEGAVVTMRNVDILGHDLWHRQSGFHGISGDPGDSATPAENANRNGGHGGDDATPGEDGTPAGDGRDAAGGILNFGDLTLERVGFGDNTARGGHGGGPGWGGAGGSSSGGRGNSDYDPFDTPEPSHPYYTIPVPGQTSLTIVDWSTIPNTETEPLPGGTGGSAGPGADGGDGAQGGSGGDAASAILNEGSLVLVDVAFGGRLTSGRYAAENIATGGAGSTGGSGGDGGSSRGGLGGDSGVEWTRSYAERLPDHPDPLNDQEYGVFILEFGTSLPGVGGAAGDGGDGGDGARGGDGGDAATLINRGTVSGTAAGGGTATAGTAGAGGQGGEGGISLGGIGGKELAAFHSGGQGGISGYRYNDDPTVPDPAYAVIRELARTARSPSLGAPPTGHRAPDGTSSDNGQDGMAGEGGTAGIDAVGLLDQTSGIAQDFAASLIYLHALGRQDSASLGFNIIRIGDTSAPAEASWRVVGTGPDPVTGADFAGGVLPTGRVTLGAAAEMAQAGAADPNVQTILVDLSQGGGPASYRIELFDVSGAQLGTAAFVGTLGDGAAPVTATEGDDRIIGTDAPENLDGLGGNDFISGGAGNDTLRGSDGVDTINGGDGDDLIFGGGSQNDLRDVVYAGAGDDSVDGGHGNDELYGMGGNDTMEGGFGVDRLIGGDGDDVLNGGAFSDQIFGGDGFDFINGGFGSDRLNGGAGADRFFHVGSAGHGSDWIQDYNAAEGDVLLYGGGPATARDFLVQIANTPGAGEAGVNEAFVTHVPSGNLLWALVDGDGQTSINIQLGGQVFDLLA